MSDAAQRSLIARFRGIFYGWWIVVVSFVVNTLTTGVYWLGFSVLFLPISRDLGVSRAAACYRLRSTRLVTARELDLLLRQEQAEHGRRLERILGIPEPDHQALRNQFRNRFVGLALEALRRKEISRAKLGEVAAMVEVGPDEVDQAVSALGLECDDSLDVQLAGSGG